MFSLALNEIEHHICQCIQVSMIRLLFDWCIIQVQLQFTITSGTKKIIMVHNLYSARLEMAVVQMPVYLGTDCQQTCC